MSRAETIRDTIIRSGDPLWRHSLNQKSTKDIAQQMERGVSRKSLMSQRKKERLQEEITATDEQKVLRIKERIEAVLNGYDGTLPETFRSELAFLRAHG